ncbi:DNA repair protein RecN [Phaeodactylibacter sp.]|jgi:DNA repair protein RecN (Recombination protein N)|uniref:DNA repair protein RecN n=1 Tax=Phaeodactylibacter sp. TaxID=1940289 RepID=UPI0025CFD667|nr:DNA repair protein RecN [Phaeodactylibacter sp.]MCI4649209.1 DNA repair protein RecN [Phaeodactylibacter sp.]MCI5090348.1 DNA repair protein RecN [Phaeodactylibacter sp.]
MIERLHIRNYAIIEELTIDFSKGLTIITGETGAGKSILLGALGLVMGRRADIKSLYNLDSKCTIEGFFNVEAYDLQSFFDEHDLDFDPQVVIRREITPSGKSRAFVNDTPVTLNVLQDLSSTLIDLHQQFDNLDIHKVSFQLRLLDALAENRPLLAQYQSLFSAYQRDQKQLKSLIDRQQKSAKELEFLQFQLEEFNTAELVDGEQEELEEELSRLTNAEDIKRTLAASFQQLSESEVSVIGQMEELTQAIKSVSSFDRRIEGLYGRFSGLVEELRDVAQEFESIADETEHDPERTQEVQERLDMVYRLQNKHQVASIKELLDIQADLQQQLDDIGDLSQEIERLQQSTQEQRQQLEAMAEELSTRRHSVVGGFENKVEQMLAQLSMQHAKLKVDISRTEDLELTGFDEVNFLFAANKGGRLQLIKDVASGGELSRLTLVVKSLVASAIPLPTLIFDEIDTGISGDVALKMGSILRQLSSEHQVVSITHSPQIASKANAHYFVYKKDKEDRTVTEVRPLEMEGRVYAIATMLSQDPPSESAINTAKELLLQSS